MRTAGKPQIDFEFAESWRYRRANGCRSPRVARCAGHGIPRRSRPKAARPETETTARQDFLVAARMQVGETIGKLDLLAVEQ